MVNNFNFVPAFNLLQNAAAVADQLAALLQQHGPEPVAVVATAFHILFDPEFNRLTIQRRWIILHCHRITQHHFQRVCILRNKLAQTQSCRLQNKAHTLLHSSDRGSSGFSFCNSCHSSRALRSRASGTATLTSTISSPRCSSRVAEGTPFSRSRSFCPLCVPGGIFSCERPSMVGTSIFAPRAASHAATGTVTWISSPSR